MTDPRIRNKKGSKKHFLNPGSTTAGMVTPQKKKFNREKFKNLVTSLVSRLNPTSLERITANISEWKLARDNAECDYYPDRTDLYRIYKNIADDSQVTSGTEQRKNVILLSEFGLYDSSGKINEEATELFEKSWFDKLLNFVTDKPFYGFSLIQMHGTASTDIEQVPPIYLSPENIAVKEDADGGVTPNNLIYYQVDPAYKDWMLEVFTSRVDIGVYNKVAPYVIWKQVFGSWSQHADIFGMDLRVINTNLEDDDRYTAAVTALETMSAAAYAILSEDDTYQTIGESKTDAYNIYEKLIDKCDAAISKILLGQTGTTDEKAFVGSAQIHKGIADDYAKKDKKFVRSWINETLLPFLVDRGWLVDGLNFKWIDTEKLSILQKKDIIKDLAPYFDFEPDFIEEYLHIEVKEKPKVSTMGNVTGDIAQEYLNRLNSKNPGNTDHIARVLNPKDFKANIFGGDKKFHDIVIEPGITGLLGVKKSNGKGQIQAYKFDKNKFTEEEAKMWLEGRSEKVIVFEPAKYTK